MTDQERMAKYPEPLHEYAAAINQALDEVGRRYLEDFGDTMPRWRERQILDLVIYGRYKLTPSDRMREANKYLSDADI